MEEEAYNTKTTQRTAALTSKGCVWHTQQRRGCAIVSDEERGRRCEISQQALKQTQHAGHMVLAATPPVGSPSHGNPYGDLISIINFII